MSYCFFVSNTETNFDASAETIAKYIEEQG